MPERPRIDPLRHRVIGIAVVAVACTAGYVLLVARSDVTVSPVWPFAVVGLTFMAAAAIILVAQRPNLTWRLLAVAGVLWFGQALILSELVPMARIGLGVHQRYLVVVFHMALAMPSGKLPSRRARRAVGAAYVVAVVVAVIDAVSGWDCAGHNAVCDGPIEFADLNRADLALTLVGRLLVVAVVVTGVVVIAAHMRVSDQATRRSAAPVLAAMAVNGILIPASDAGLLGGSDTERWLRLVGAWLVPIAVLAGALLVKLHRAQVVDLMVALDRGLTPEELRDELARTLGDDTLVVCFPSGDGFVDHHGQPVTPGTPGRAATPVEHDDELIAVLDHVVALREEPELLAATAAASRLALENARLNATVQAQLSQLEQSRRHLVEASDRERRRIERDLHDGAQQKLLSVALALGRERRRASQAGHHDTAAALHSIIGDLETAVDELRSLARGLYPTVLTDHGLPAAVDALAQRTPLPLDVDFTLPRLPTSTESTAYFVVVEALANTIRHAGATGVRVSGRVDEDDLEVTVSDDGIGGADVERGSGLRNLHDRARALGGSVEIHSPAGGGTTLTLRLPVGTPA
ncbi:MAG TPA: ATP-binding protein [Ilumatobacteraceae bacterium]|nr:ATP-binding protein [Ilumatobacteraceae bacterium]